MSTWFTLGCTAKRAAGEASGGGGSGAVGAATSATPAVRFDGVYACRTPTGVTSAGGFNVWPLRRRPGRVDLVEFFRFGADGNVQFWFTRQPVTTDEAMRLFRETKDHPHATRGDYQLDGSHLSLTVTGRTLTMDREVRREYTGRVNGHHLVLTEQVGDAEERTFIFEPAPAR